MGQVKVDPNTGQVEITYGGPECPFEGLDNSAAPPYIDPGALLTGTVNVLPVNKQLIPVGLTQSPILLTLTNTQSYIGSGDLNNQQFIVIYDSSNNNIIVYFDTSGGDSGPIFGSSFSSVSFCDAALLMMCERKK